MPPSTPCCRWVKSPRPSCSSGAHTTGPWTCPLRVAQGHCPHKIPMKDHPCTLPWTSVPPLPICSRDACGFSMLGSLSSLPLVGGGMAPFLSLAGHWWCGPVPAQTSSPVVWRPESSPFTCSGKHSLKSSCLCQGVRNCAVSS